MNVEEENKLTRTVPLTSTQPGWHAHTFPLHTSCTYNNKNKSIFKRLRYGSSLYTLKSYMKLFICSALLLNLRGAIYKCSEANFVSVIRKIF